jgi:hypothetical protein
MTGNPCWQAIPPVAVDDGKVEELYKISAETSNQLNVCNDPAEYLQVSVRDDQRCAIV